MLRLLLLLCTLVAATNTLASQNLLFILDGSGSMWGRVDGEPKITVARQVMGQLIGELPDNSQVGLMAYGHSRKGDCGDIETLTPLGPLQRERLIRQVQNINPRGKTPITAAVKRAVTQLRSLEDTASVVLISDGLESCNGDPCAAARAARESGVEFRLHVVGFDLGDADTGELRCMAEATGGQYFTANNAEELGDALNQAVAPPAGLRVTVTANGEPLEARTYLHHADSGDEADRARTDREGIARYALEPGLYRLTIRPDGIDAADRVLESLEVVEGQALEKTVDFSAGELVLRITANGEPLKARTYAHDQESGREVARQRTNREGLAGYEIPPGTYRVTIRPDGISAPERQLEDIVVAAGERREEHQDFSFGRLELTVTSNGEPLSARTYVTDVDSGKEADRSRTNRQGIASYKIPPGSYRIRVRPRGIAAPDQTIEGVTLPAGETLSRSLEIPSGSLEVQVSNGEAALEARTYLSSAETGREIDRHRTNNAGEARYEVPVGEYVLRVRPPRGLDADDRHVEGIIVKQGEISQVKVDFSSAT